MAARGVRRVAYVLAPALLMVPLSQYGVRQLDFGSKRAAVSDSSFVAGYRSVTAGFEQALVATRAQREAAAKGDGSQAVAVYRAVLDATRDARDGYGGLEPPGAVAGQYARFLELLDAQIGHLSAAVSASGTTDVDRLNSALQQYAVTLGQWVQARESLGGALGLPATGSSAVL